MMLSLSRDAMLTWVKIREDRNSIPYDSPEGGFHSKGFVHKLRYAADQTKWEGRDTLLHEVDELLHQHDLMQHHIDGYLLTDFECNDGPTSTSLTQISASVRADNEGDMTIAQHECHISNKDKDTAARVGALAYGNTKATRKSTFESELKYALNELPLSTSYVHTKNGIGGTLFQTDNRGTIDQHMAKKSMMMSAISSNGEKKVAHDALFAVTRLQLKKEKGPLWNKNNISGEMVPINAAASEQISLEDSTDERRYACVSAAVSTAASYSTGLVLRVGAGGKIDGYDLADMSADTTRSLFQSYVMESAEQTIQRRTALSLEKGALEQDRVPLKLKTAAAAGTIILISNVVRHHVRKSRARARAKERKRLAEMRHREDVESQPKAKTKQALVDPHSVLPISFDSPSERETFSKQWLPPTMQDVGVVAGTSLLDLTPVAVQIAMAGAKNVFLATSCAGLAIDALHTGWSLRTGKITKEQAHEQICTAAVSTVASVGGVLCVELLADVIALAGLPMAVFVGIGTALAALGVQWVVTTIFDWRRKAVLQGEYKQLCKLLDVAEMCTDSELTRAWRDASRRVHPDKGGSHEAFVELNDRHKRVIELRILLGHSIECEDGLLHNERTRMPTWIRWWLHVLTNLNASLRQEHVQPVPPIDALTNMLDLYHPVSDRFTEWQSQQAVYAAELDE